MAQAKREFEIIVPQEATVYWRYTVRSVSPEAALRRLRSGNYDTFSEHPVEIEAYDGDDYDAAEVREVASAGAA